MKKSARYNEDRWRLGASSGEHTRLGCGARRPAGYSVRTCPHGCGLSRRWAIASTPPRRIRFIGASPNPMTTSVVPLLRTSVSSAFSVVRPTLCLDAFLPTPSTISDTETSSRATGACSAR